MSYCFGRNRYIFPTLIYSKLSLLTSSCAIYRALNPIFSAMQAAGIYGDFLHSLYAFFIKESDNFFSCAIIKDMLFKYIRLMYHDIRNMKYVFRRIKYICNMAHIIVLR